MDDRILDQEFQLTPVTDENPSYKETQTQPRNNQQRASGGSFRLKKTIVRFGERYRVDDVTVNTVHGHKEVTSISYVELQQRAFKRTSKMKKGSSAEEPPVFIQYALADNQQILEKVFRLPINADIIIRKFRLGGEHVADAMAIFVDGIADKTIINNHILEPLMMLSDLEHDIASLTLEDRVQNVLLPGNQVMKFSTYKDAIENILAGSTVLFIDGVNVVISVETKGWEHRPVGINQTEAAVRGPHDAFTENFRSNTGLVRSKLRSPNLITEMRQLGTLASTDIAIMYMDGVVNPNVVKEVMRRIESIKVDYVPESGLVEQFIEDAPMGVIPKLLSTERPDRVAYGLTEGQVAIFVGHSPYVLLVPVLFWSLLQTAEDAYLHWPFGTFIRFIRVIALFIALLLPALYISVTNFHPEMIPTEIMLSIASSRERVPFPVVIEVLIMEFSIELIREAGIRIPSVIGPTIGIVGALILGQAAVAAGIISPLLIIVVAVTALGSFTMPNYNLSFTVRVLRFGFIASAAVFGFYGIILLFMVLMMHAVTLRSLGVPILSPIAPRRNSSPDTIWRAPAYKMEVRPNPYFPIRKRRQTPMSRSWSPLAKDADQMAQDRGDNDEEKRK